jgi:hypothetical protein
VLLAIECAKELDSDAPVISHRGSRSYKKIKWSQVNPGDLRVQIQAASDMSRTPAGRLQLALEFAQAGIISTDSAREMMADLDSDAEMSLYRAQQEDIDRCLDEIVDGEQHSPEPYDSLEMLVWRGTRRYKKERADGCPEEILEGIRQYIVQGAAMLAMAQEPPPAAAGMTDATGAAPMAPPMDMAPPMGAPPMEQPAAALSGAAMHSVA